MRVFVSADMEGITGVAGKDVLREDAGYEQARQHLHDDINAAVEGAVAAGAEEILVKDAHSGMTNLQRRDLDDRSRLIRGPSKSEGMMQGLTAEYDVAFFVGYHAKAGTAGAVLNHTLLFTDLLRLRVNGEEVGELGWNARLAASLDVPVGLVSGDDKTVAEATAELEDVETVTVKTGIDRFTADCRPAEETQTEIRDGAERAVERAADEGFDQPTAVTSPVQIEADWVATNHAEAAARAQAVTRTDGRTTAVESTSYDEAYEAAAAMVVVGAQSE